MPLSLEWPQRFQTATKCSEEQVCVYLAIDIEFEFVKERNAPLCSLVMTNGIQEDSEIHIHFDRPTLCKCS